MDKQTQHLTHCLLLAIVCFSIILGPTVIALYCIIPKTTTNDYRNISASTDTFTDTKNKQYGYPNKDIDIKVSNNEYEDLYHAPTFPSTTDCADKPSPTLSIFIPSATRATKYNNTQYSLSNSNNDTTLLHKEYEQTADQQKTDSLLRILKYNIHANITNTVQVQLKYDKYKNKTYNLNVPAVKYNKQLRHNNVERNLKAKDKISSLIKISLSILALTNSSYSI